MRKKTSVACGTKIKSFRKDFNLIRFELDWADFTSDSSIAVKNLHCSRKSAIKQYLPKLTYIAGYCSFSVGKKLQCKDCKLRITYQGIDVQYIENTLISGISKGSLLYPSRNVVDMIVTSYLMVNGLAETKEFQFSPYQRQHIIHATLSALDADEFVFFYEDACECGHEPIQVTKMIVWVCTNILLNNLCFNKNDKLVQESQSKKRKIRTLT